MSLKSYYQYCIVPSCVNNSKRTPAKLFIPVPRDPETRKQWLDRSRRDWTQLSANSTMYFCEDHFDLPNDMENYIKFRVLGSVKKIIMRKGCLPSRFECQPDRKRTATNDCSDDDTKRKRQEIIQKNLDEDDLKRIQNTDSLQDNQLPQAITENDEKHQKKTPLVQDKDVQVQIYNKYRSKGSQIMVKLSCIGTSPIKSFSGNVSVSTCTEIPSTSGNTHINNTWRFGLHDQQTSESEVSLFTPSVKLNSSSSAESLQLASDSSLNDEFLKVESDFFKEESLQHTLKKIKRNPRYYIGVPEKCFFLVNIIEKQHNIPEKHIMLCLKKLRLNTTFSELGDEFGISLNYASKIFLKNVPIIAKALQQFIIKLDDNTDKAHQFNLPIAFRHKYFNVSCIIDCLEIEIQKPTKAFHQALTWSEYKKGNTIKYLISCTPDGLINYISPGYGGRISDVLLVENCDFLNSLRPGTCLLANRGFKHIDQLLSQKGIKLIRPPSLPSGIKFKVKSKFEVKITKQIASIRIHVERVIRRLREFSMFKPHSVINTNLLRIVDEAVTICCALINLQDGIIK